MIKRSAFLAYLAAMFGVAKAQQSTADDDKKCFQYDAGLRQVLVECNPKPPNGMCPTSQCFTMADPFPHNIVRGELKPYTQLIDCKHCRNAYFVDSIDPKDMPKVKQ